jgi:hypothetical protein
MLEKLSLPGPNSKYQVPEAQPAGFWAGVWHGSMAPITFLVSLFKPGVRIYETHNAGLWYDFGFIIGAAIAFGGKKQVVVTKKSKPEEEDEEEEEEE